MVAVKRRQIETLSLFTNQECAERQDGREPNGHFEKISKRRGRDREGEGVDTASPPRHKTAARASPCACVSFSVCSRFACVRVPAQPPGGKPLAGGIYRAQRQKRKERKRTKFKCRRLDKRKYESRSKRLFCVAFFVSPVRLRVRCFFPSSVCNPFPLTTRPFHPDAPHAHTHPFIKIDTHTIHTHNTCCVPSSSTHNPQPHTSHRHPSINHQQIN